MPDPESRFRDVAAGSARETPDEVRGAGGGGGGGARPPPPPRDTGPSAAEAYRTLGLDPGADADAVRRAYRERVKSVHPDRDTGDEDEFLRVKEAYERLQDAD
ncbi:J domain-containing protein [Halorussus amylolyticus]|uniref:J domain-containing protein n=1 Tax=Halorussus amylolyticus TaxID=1126242 RepID=UPI001EE42BF1|nr:J domain-containing protein [Halorussus amylolyticus]